MYNSVENARDKLLNLKRPVVGSELTVLVLNR